MLKNISNNNLFSLALFASLAIFSGAGDSYAQSAYPSPTPTISADVNACLTGKTKGYFTPSGRKYCIQKHFDYYSETLVSQAKGEPILVTSVLSAFESINGSQSLIGNYRVRSSAQAPWELYYINRHSYNALNKIYSTYKFGKLLRLDVPQQTSTYSEYSPLNFNMIDTSSYFEGLRDGNPGQALPYYSKERYESKAKLFFIYADDRRDCVSFAIGQKIVASRDATPGIFKEILSTSVRPSTYLKKGEVVAFDANKVLNGQLIGAGNALVWDLNVLDYSASGYRFCEIASPL
jgi:hypothetical protein